MPNLSHSKRKLEISRSAYLLSWTCPNTYYSQDVYTDLSQLQRRDTNWTTQAFQTNCDNINYQDFTDCCQQRSGAGWQSCNDAGSYWISGSSVLCYNLNAGHDCCSDDSVCDTNLGCCGNTCCQSSTSITVCKDGCVSKNGAGCSDGTCAHGISHSSSSSSAGSPTITSISGSASASSADSSATTDLFGSSPSSSSTSSSSQDKGLSSGGIIGIAVSVSCSVLGLLFGVIFKIWKWERQQK